MNGDEVKADISRGEGIMNRLSRIVERSRTIRGEIQVVTRLITGDTGERAEKEPGEKREKPDNILAVLEYQAEEIDTELTRLDASLDHLKESVGTSMFERTERVDR